MPVLPRREQATHWTFDSSNNNQREMIIEVLTGTNEGTLVVSDGCP
jgi:hypothetical protein